MKSIFTQNEIQFLLSEYPTHGAEYCSQKLRKPIKQIKTKVKKLQHYHDIHLVPELKKKQLGHRKGIFKTDPTAFRVNPLPFCNVQTKEVAYLLGLIWSDGYVYNSPKYCKISVEMMESDIIYLLPIFKITGQWTTTLRKRKNRKPQLNVSTTNRVLGDFLIENGYSSKNIESAEKILNNIPEYLKPYWFRGLVDGDGCFYINKKEGLHQFSVSSSFDQDWLYLENLFKALGIHYSISRKTQKQKNGKISKGSSIRVSNKSDIQKIGNYLYQGFNEDKIGLFRKYHKYRLICDDLTRD